MPTHVESSEQSTLYRRPENAHAADTSHYCTSKSVILTDRSVRARVVETNVHNVSGRPRYQASVRIRSTDAGHLDPAHRVADHAPRTVRSQTRLGVVVQVASHSRLAGSRQPFPKLPTPLRYGGWGLWARSAQRTQGHCRGKRLSPWHRRRHRLLMGQEIPRNCSSKAFPVARGAVPRQGHRIHTSRNLRVPFEELCRHREQPRY